MALLQRLSTPFFRGQSAEFLIPDFSASEGIACGLGLWETAKLEHARVGFWPDQSEAGAVAQEAGKIACGSPF
jgi:hypothetical protein